MGYFVVQAEQGIPREKIPKESPVAKSADVNLDGKPDIISSGWMKMSGVYWYENPGKPGVKWKQHLIHSARAMEGFVMGDIAGHRNGDQDVLINHWSPIQGENFTWYEHIDKEPWLLEHVLGFEGQEHGNGIGDINGDGRNDINGTEMAGPTSLWRPM